MCLIIDTNVAGQVFDEEPIADLRPVTEWLLSKKHQARLALGGRLKEELFQIGRVRAALTSLFRAGRVKIISDGQIQQEEQALTQLGICASNDLHLLALARLSGARLLCSNDENLHADFKNHKIIATPRGRIYQSADHKDLLFRRDMCG